MHMQVNDGSQTINSCRVTVSGAYNDEELCGTENKERTFAQEPSDDDHSPVNIDANEDSTSESDSFESKPDKISGLESQPKTPLDKFLAQLDDATASVEKYRDQLYETLTAAYEPCLFYFAQNAATQKQLKAELVARYEAAGFNVTKKTTIEHMVLKCAFGRLSDATVSTRAIALKAAREGDISAAHFAGWVGKDGIQAVVNEYRQKNNGGKSGAPALPRSELIELGKKQIASTTMKTFKADDMGDFEAETVNQDTEAVAIVTRHPGGGFTLKGFVISDAAINEAYATLGKKQK